MISGNLKEFVAALNADLWGEDAKFSGVVIDTRQLTPGAVFAALRGQHVDGHDFAAMAAERGAAALLVERKVDVALPQWVVADVRLALGDLARSWRRRFDTPVIGVTGSNGKTTVKQMLGSILSQAGETLVTQGNLNNDLGVPLTLFRLGKNHQAAVVEMGANHAGEIEYLVKVAEPVIGVITNAGPAHLEGFGSVEGVALAKGEMFTGLPPDGMAVINASDNHAALWREMAGHCRQLTFGLDTQADFRVDREQLVAVMDGSPRTRVIAQTPYGPTEWEIPLLGSHNVANALAAAAAAWVAGATPVQIVDGLAQMQPAQGRLAIRAGRRGARLIDDSYNANPLSLAAALHVLADMPGRHWLVLGDMGELGPQGESLHVQAGELAKQTGVEKLFALGDLAAKAARAFGAAGMSASSPQALLEAVIAELPSSAQNVVILIKGSRAMHLEQVVAGLLPT